MTSRRNPTMPTAIFPRRRAYRGWLLALAALTVGGAGLWFARPHIAAWCALADGRSALETGDPEAARRHLDRCLAVWPASAEAHFLAGRAALRGGDLEEADRHLVEAARLGWPDGQLGTEREELDAACDRLGQVARTLGGEFRWPEADAVTRRWVGLRPENPAAWKLRGEVVERLRRLGEAVDALRRAVALAPADRQARSELARLLLETRLSADEAAGHLEWLVRTAPPDAATRVQLATCREAQGRPDEAVAILNAVVAEHPAHPAAFRARGRLELNRGHPQAAVPFLRRAAELDPSDPPTLYSLFLALQQAGLAGEAGEVEARWKRATADLARVAELGRAIARSPHDPELRREMGELFLRNGRDADALRWLESAIRERPDHAPTHRALAAYYDRTGKTDLAARHRAIISDRRP